MNIRCPVARSQSAPSASGSGQAATKGGRSAFTFDKPGKGKKGANNNNSSGSGKQSKGPSVAPPVSSLTV